MERGCRKSHTADWGIAQEFGSISNVSCTPHWRLEPRGWRHGDRGRRRGEKDDQCAAPLWCPAGKAQQCGRRTGGKEQKGDEKLPGARKPLWVFHNFHPQLIHLLMLTHLGNVNSPATSARQFLFFASHFPARRPPSASFPRFSSLYATFWVQYDKVKYVLKSTHRTSEPTSCGLSLRTCGSLLLVASQ